MNIRSLVASVVSTLVLTSTAFAGCGPGGTCWGCPPGTIESGGPNPMCVPVSSLAPRRSEVKERLFSDVIKLTQFQAGSSI